MLRRKQSERFETYAPTNLKIRTKSGAVQPFLLNKAQRYLHERIEQQLIETGRVRALILKGRQQGCSTYVEGRFYWKTSRVKGVRTFILTHEQEATDNLFDIANRFHEHDPGAPETNAANAKELDFAALDSGYRVATAGTKAVGRSQTLQLLHGSEVAFWPNAATHRAGVIQAVPDMPGTEIILESTANGVGGVFHAMWQESEVGLSEYQAIFIPWYWQDEYRKAVGKDFVPSDDEQAYADAYGLDNAQVMWRRMKIHELGDESLFKQEYPATAAEAFQISGEDGFIRPELVLKARKASVLGYGPLVIGVDPARFGDGRFSVAYRIGRKVSKVESRAKLDTVSGANWVKTIIDRDKPARVFIDVGGLGAGTFDILTSWGEPYEGICKAINFGGAPMEPDIWIENAEQKMEKRPGPVNRRAEMWLRSRDWLEAEGGADIPDLDSLQADACGPRFKYDMKQRIVLEAKEHMRARGVRSPDEWDAVVLTFAEPVADPRLKGPPQNIRGRGRDRLVGV